MVNKEGVGFAGPINPCVPIDERANPSSQGDESNLKQNDEAKEVMEGDEEAKKRGGGEARRRGSERVTKRKGEKVIDAIVGEKPEHTT